MEVSWPGKETIERLVYRADGLFIFAATTCRFLEQRKTKLEDRLKMVLGTGADEMDAMSPQGQLDALYIDILRAEVLGDMTATERREKATQFKKIVGSIIILSEPLAMNVLSGLVSDEPEETELEVEEMLRSLQPVMNVFGDDSSIERLHL